MLKFIFLLLFMVGCTNTIVVNHQKHVPVFGPERKGKIILKNQDTLSVDNIVIIDNSIRFMNDNSTSRSEIPIDSVSRIVFFSRGRGALYGVVSGFISGLAGGLLLASEGIKDPAPCDEDCGADLTELVRFWTIIGSSAGGACIGLISGYLIGYKDIYVFK